VPGKSQPMLWMRMPGIEADGGCGLCRIAAFGVAGVRGVADQRSQVE
jgi:hypothetical protein